MRHADFTVHPTSAKDLLSRAQFAAGMAAALQMLFGSLGIVKLLWEPLRCTECAFMDPDLFFLCRSVSGALLVSSFTSRDI